MNWTVLAIAWMAAWSACLVWFVLLVVRRARSPRKKSMPLWGRIGELVIDGVALPVLLLNAGLTGAWVPLVAVGIALTLWTFAPRSIASLVIPATLLGVAFNGFILVRAYSRGALWVTPYGLTGTAYGSRFTHSVLPQACAFFAGGLWLGWRRLDRQSWLYRRVLYVAGHDSGESNRPRWGLVLLPLVGVLVELLGRTSWLGLPWWSAAVTLTVAAAALVLVIRAPAIAADLAIVGVILLGLYGVALAAWWPAHIPLPSPYTYRRPLRSGHRGQPGHGVAGRRAGRGAHWLRPVADPARHRRPHEAAAQVGGGPRPDRAGNPPDPHQGGRRRHRDDAAAQA